MNLLADKILDFYADVNFEGRLPEHIGIMNPYRESEDIRTLCGLFYLKYYGDSNQRKLILGINPGRLGAGATGIPFTDTKRLNDDCGIRYSNFITHEPSSVFIYEMIRAFGGPEAFYSRFYINSVCPLGFIKVDGNKTVNYNYYDSRELEIVMKDFIIQNIKKQIDLSGSDQVCYCLGTGKNFNFLKKLNDEYRFFGEIIPLEHPRYIMQYKNKYKEQYIDDYLQKLNK
jgi:Domain of unknown function (DUF4918)